MGNDLENARFKAKQYPNSPLGASSNNASVFGGRGLA
ncbi:uncharacterized protein G2W53_003657 [Senna tora]|uniref:Uncharacterized protein n=1 Tax=Senna tora TaxID=362788 RepID=A0A834XAJ0_9FABA|nr:uncharacterized protein G2W53_003657 [Senna tora]